MRITPPVVIVKLLRNKLSFAILLSLSIFTLSASFFAPIASAATPAGSLLTPQSVLAASSHSGKILIKRVIVTAPAYSSFGQSITPLAQTGIFYAQTSVYYQSWNGLYEIDSLCEVFRYGGFYSDGVTYAGQCNFNQWSQFNTSYQSTNSASTPITLGWTFTNQTNSSGWCTTLVHGNGTTYALDVTGPPSRKNQEVWLQYDLTSCV